MAIDVKTTHTTNKQIVIVNTPLVRVVQDRGGYSMYITCKDGTIVEHEPFPNNLEGMVAAISLSAEICAGKFFLSKVVQSPSFRDRPQLETKRKSNMTDDEAMDYSKQKGDTNGN